MTPRVHLVVRHAQRVVPLAAGETVTAGRSDECALQLDDPSVSRRHCLFVLADGGLRVTDLGSANGTFVNDRPVHEAAVAVGDVVRLGAAVIDVREQAGDEDALDEDVDVDDSTPHSVIQRTIDPSGYAWLSPASGEAAGAGTLLLERAQRHLSALHRVSERLAASRDISSLTDTTLRTILQVLPADRSAILLRRQGEHPGEAEVLAARSKGRFPHRFAVSRTLLHDVMAQGISVFAHDACQDARFSAGESVIGQQIRSVMCVPLRTSGDVLGALYVDSLSGAGRFNEADLELLAAIGNQAGVAMHRVRLMGELERLLLDTIRAIAATIDARDGYTHRHSERVAAIAAQLARELGLTSEQRETAELSALLHDVGKIAVPDSILNKPGKLTEEEFAQMRKHPELGARILKNIQSATVDAVIPGVQYHHEKWDGTGYPEGLQGDAIPFLGRLLGVADFYDALTSARAYRAAMPAGDAIKLVASGSGTHFDPAIAAAAVRLFERGALNVDAMPSEIRHILSAGRS